MAKVVITIEDTEETKDLSIVVWFDERPVDGQETYAQHLGMSLAKLVAAIEENTPIAKDIFAMIHRL